MTDRLKGFVVTLTHDIREDDAEAIVNAIRMVRGVLDVQPVVSTYEDVMNRTMVRHELEAKILDAIRKT
jgi:hypothetical protein